MKKWKKEEELTEKLIKPQQVPNTRKASSSEHAISLLRVLMQVEAAGTWVRCLHLQKLGVNCWRDMDAEDLTKGGYENELLLTNNEVFLMFLTNSLLSRPFCLKEIGWALDFDKPIVIVVETENRVLCPI